MKKAEQAKRVRAISQYLEGINLPVTSVQGYEILARALGLKNKHVLASHGDVTAEATEPAFPTSFVIDGDVIPVRPLDAKPYTVAEMKALDWNFDVIIPLDLDDLREGDQDLMNEKASKFITGLDYALEDLCFQHVAKVNYGDGYAAYRVTAYVARPADHWQEVEDEENIKFYADLVELADALHEGLPICVKAGIVNQNRVARAVDPKLVSLLKAYGQASGANNDEVNKHYDTVVMELHPRDESLPEIDRYVLKVVLGDLKYATKENAARWNVCLGRNPGLLVELALNI